VTEVALPASRPIFFDARTACAIRVDRHTRAMN
jgi:hypothetical protein